MRQFLKSNVFAICLVIVVAVTILVSWREKLRLWTHHVAPDTVEIRYNVVYASVDGHLLHLDLYIPRSAPRPVPVVVWIHGGGWLAGARGDSTPLPLLLHGFAVADVEYRLSQEAIFPAQIHDCKAAVRWLRANAAKYGIDPERIGAWGQSAGGHLVALLGTTGGHAELEGDEGNLDQSSRVAAVCDYFGVTDFLNIDEQGSDPGWRKEIAHMVMQLIGGPIPQNRDKARQASPVYFVDAQSCPFLIVHGDADPTVPIAQSIELDAALRKAGVESSLYVVPGAGHGFKDPEAFRRVLEFFRRHLEMAPLPKGAARGGGSTQEHRE